MTPPRERGRRAGAVASLEAFPTGRARDFVAAIRAFDNPAWRHDPNVTPTWVDRVLALAPDVDAVAVAKRAAAWWTEKPARTRGRRSCTGTLRTFLDREAERPSRATASGPAAPSTGAAAACSAQLEAARAARAQQRTLPPSQGTPP